MTPTRSPVSSWSARAARRIVPIWPRSGTAATCRRIGTDLWWSHSNAKIDFYTEFKDYGDDFRADQGFVPQVGYRSNYVEGGYTFHPKGFFSRVRAFAMGEYDSQQDGSRLYSLKSAGFGTDGKFRSFTRIRLADENFRNDNQVLERKQLFYTVQFAVSRLIPQVSFDGWVGQDIDFFNNRVGHGAQCEHGRSVPSDFAAPSHNHDHFAVAGRAS